MARAKTKTDEYKDIFVKMHRYQVHGATNLIMLLTRYMHGKADYMAKVIDLVAERTGVSHTGRITTTNADIMKRVVSELVEIDKGVTPIGKDIDAAWEAFISDYRNHRIKL